MVSDKKNGGDIAGEKYWSTQWERNNLPVGLWDVDSTHFRNSVERRLFALMWRSFENHLHSTKGKKLLEVGCARSDVLPLFSIKCGFDVYGIDYSALGCQQARQILKRENVSGEILCCDVFNPPEVMLANFDAIVSFGLVEHFSDTQATVAAMAKLLRPGGIMFTHIPNMNGITGLTQRFFDHSVFSMHIPLNSEQLRAAHFSAGLKVIMCEYFMSTNFGVTNIDSIDKYSAEWKIKRFLLTWITRMSKAVWLAEQHVGEFPVGRLFSPYINCVAIKPVAASGADAL